MVRYLAVTGALCFLGLLATGCSNSDPAQISTTGVPDRTGKIMGYTYEGKVSTTAINTRSVITLSSDNPYTFDLVRRNGTQIQHFQKIGSGNWVEKQPFGLTQASPAICTFSDKKLQVVSREDMAPAKKLVHYWHNKDNDTWVRQAEISMGSYSVKGSPSMIYNATNGGTLELVTYDGNRVLHLSRDAAFNWSSPSALPIGTNYKVYSDPVITQTLGDNRLHVVAIVYTGTPAKYYLAHWAKKLGDPSWSQNTYYDNGKIDKYETPAIAGRDIGITTYASIQIVYKQTTAKPTEFKCVKTLSSDAISDDYPEFVTETKGILGCFAACSHSDAMSGRTKIHLTMYDKGIPQGNHHISFVSWD